MSDRTYIGGGRQKMGSANIELFLDVQDILAAEHVEYRGRKYLKCIVTKRWKPSDTGVTHSVVLPEKERTYNDRLTDEQESGQ